MDTTTSVAGIETVVEDLDALKYDVGELKDLLNNNKGEINHVRRIVLACERDMEDFTAAMDAVNVDLDEMRARVDATHSIITSRQRVEATMTAEISTMRLDIGDIQEALKNHDSWMEDVSNTLQQMQEKEENLTEDLINLKNEMNAKLDTKVDNFFFRAQAFEDELRKDQNCLAEEYANENASSGEHFLEKEVEWKRLKLKICYGM